MVMKTKCVDRIWLQDGEDYEETTWCPEKIHDSDVEYVRVDVVNKQHQAQREEWIRDIKKWGEMLKGGTNEWLVDDLIETLRSKS